MIESLTEEQQAKFPYYVDKWTKIGLSTDNSNCKDVEEDLAKIYKEAKLDPPKVLIFVSSPLAANYLINIIVEAGEYDIEDPEKMTLEALRTEAERICPKLKSYNGDACYGQHDASWLSFYDFFKTECDLKECERLEGYYSIARKTGWFFPSEENCIICEKPSQVRLDALGRLHSEEDYAIEFSDGCSYCAFHGVRVPSYVIFEPSKISIDDIESETNAEVRRVKTTKYGDGRYLEDTGAVLKHEDDWGKLYHKDMGPRNEPLAMVKVINSTPEHDGTYKDYYLRVDPVHTTAHAAVASTFRMTKEEYDPIEES